ncbi:hypothetical protein P7M38_24895, partial [Vibrio parahaemolyticus]|nr:hypothetical protein [Vibrio parahaemolyticus]
DLKSRTAGYLSIIFDSNQIQSTGLFHLGRIEDRINDIMLIIIAGFMKNENLILINISSLEYIFVILS